jgi:hypothetical protein
LCGIKCWHSEHIALPGLPHLRHDFISIVDQSVNAYMYQRHANNAIVGICAIRPLTVTTFATANSASAVYMLVNYRGCHRGIYTFNKLWYLAAMRAIDVIGHMELDEDSLQQLQAFILHYEPHIIAPARRTTAGWIWEAFLKGHDGVCTIVTVDLVKLQSSGIDDWVSQVISLALLHHEKVNHVLALHPTSATLLSITANLKPWHPMMTTGLNSDT